MNIKEDVIHVYSDIELDYYTNEYSADENGLLIKALENKQETRHFAVWQKTVNVTSTKACKLTYYFESKVPWAIGLEQEKTYICFYVTVDLPNGTREAFFIDPTYVLGDTYDAELNSCCLAVPNLFLVTPQLFQYNAVIKDFQFTNESFKALVTQGLNEYIATMERCNFAQVQTILPESGWQYPILTTLGGFLTGVSFQPSIIVNSKREFVMENPSATIKKTLEKILSNPILNLSEESRAKTIAYVDGLQADLIY